MWPMNTHHIISGHSSGTTDSASVNALLIAESNHRIANNLSLVAGIVRQQSKEVLKFGRTLTPHEASQLLNEVGQRIDMVGRFHRMLAQPTQDNIVDLGGYLHDVAASAIASMSSEGFVRLEPIPSDHCEIHTSQAMVVGLIVGELVTNSVKYAHPARVKGVIKLTCRKLRGATVIRLEDDGVGLPDGFDPATGGGLGLRMTRLLAQQLRGQLTFHSTELGLCVELRVPYLAGPEPSTFNDMHGSAAGSDC